jgi:hypothetical protein
MKLSYGKLAAIAILTLMLTASTIAIFSKLFKTSPSAPQDSSNSSVLGIAVILAALLIVVGWLVFHPPKNLKQTDSTNLTLMGGSHSTAAAV